ncbi:response regulator transcription factor [Effusibacillus lacus]|uniref:DNA-binding response regulator n=1 Tax=Effusibacillus lacus TaxID=1348429 RepID=A0A292YI40_9BACL|nr:response regulator transcription factor [Effusibacillus lacus]TCS70512.1 LuxR family two component transcriptional regulator [Effusibacillus lacus]GAX89538.1 DNA-binding response regulator [Effusibacillus lacus]
MSKPIKVMLVDDHPLVMNGLRNWLEGEPDIQVVGAFDNGITAFEEMRQLLPDVVVLDIRMPGINGLELARQIKGEYGDSVKLVILSGYVYEEYQRTAFEIGVHAFVPKNASYDQILNAIRQSALGNYLIFEKTKQYETHQLLTPTEIQVLQLVAQEKTNGDIAKELNMAKRTVEYHISSIIQKLGADSRIGAVVKGFQKGIIE